MKSRTLTLLVCLGISVAIFARAKGDTFTWDADGSAANGAQDGSGTWSTTNLNWFSNTGTPDISWTNNLTDIASFGSSGGTGGTIVLGESISSGGILFNGSDSASFNFTGTQSLTVGPSGITLQSGAGAESFAAGVSLTLSVSQNWTNSSANALTISGSITGSSSANTTLTLLGTGSINLAALADGAGKQLSLTRGGSGTVNLTAASSYTGGTTLTSGSIVAKNSQALGATASPLALNGGSLDLAIDSSIAAYNTTVGGNATILSDLATSSVGITHSLGTLSIGANTLTVKAGANVASGTAGLAYGNLTPSGSPTFDVQNNVGGVLTQLTIGATNFSGTNRSLTKSGAGTLVIGGPATGVASATGLDQTINAGTLQFNASHGWDGGASASTADGQLVLSPIAANTANYQTQNLDQRVTTVKFAGAASTTTAIALGSTGTLSIRSGANSVVYDATGNPGTATVSGGSSSKFQFLTATSAFVIGDSSNTTSELVIAAPVFAGTLTKSGAGTLVFQGANFITNNMTVSAGILRLDGTGTFPSRLTLTGGIVELGSGQTTFTHPAGTSANQVDVNTGTTGFGNSNSTAANINLDTSVNMPPLWGNSGFTASTFQLGTSASLAPLNLVGGINVGSTTTNAIQVDRGNFTLTAANYYDAQIQQSTSTMLGTGTLAKQGSGVLSIIGSPSSTNSTALNVNAGTVLLANTSGNAWGTGPVAVASAATIGGAGTTGGTLTTSSGGHIAPGNGVNGGGLLTFAGNLTISNGTILDYDLSTPGGAIGASGNDGLKTTGSIATFGTGLTLNITPGASFGNGTYPLIQFTGVGPAAGSLSNFTTVNGPTKTYGFASSSTTNGFVNLTVAALTQYWDLNGATAGAGGSTPNGTWDTATANWSVNSAGTVAAVTWGSANDAVFSAGTDATGSYTVTLTGTQNANSITFKNGTPTLTGGSLNISGAGGSVSVTTTSSAIDSLLVGTAGLTKSGAGTLNLTNSGNSYTGITTISGGILSVTTLAVEGSGGGTASSLGSAGNAAANLIINGGTLQYTNNSGGTTDRSFTIGTAGATLDASGPGGGLNFNSATSAIAFSSSGSPASLTLTGTNTGAISAVIGNSGTGTNITSITKTGIGAWTLLGANTYTGTTTVSSGTLQFTTGAIEGSGGGVASSLGAAGNAASKLVINGGILQFSGASSQTTDRSFTIGASGATLSTSGSPGTSITFNTSTPAIAFSSSNTPTTLNLTGQPNTSGSLGAVLGNNGSGVVSLVKNGLGTWTLAATDTYTGATTVSLGTLNVNGSIANSAVTVNGGALGGTGTVGAVTINSGGAISPGNSPGTLSAGNTTWNGGGAYTWEINSVAGGGTTATPTGNLAGSQGHDPGWDTLAVNGTLTIGATTGNSFIVNVTGLNTSNSPGAVNLFNQNLQYVWNIATATTALNGYTGTAQFSVNTTNFINFNAIGNGSFFVLRTGSGANSAMYLINSPNTLGVLAADNAANYFSFGGSTTLNKGAGFGNWQFSPNPNTGTGGYFLGDAGINAGGSNSGTPSGNWINGRTITTTNGTSWGLFANSGNVTSAIRPIAGGLPIGATFAIDLDNGFLNNGSSQGFSLLNSSGDTTDGKLFEFFFKNGGANSYSVTTGGTSTAETITGTTSGFTGNGLHVEFTQTSAAAFTMTVAGPNIITQTITGSLLTPNTGNSAIASFRPFAFNANAGDTSSDFNAFFNNAMVLLPTWNGLSIGVAGGNFSAANWAGHGPVNGGSIAFDGTGSTVTNDSAASGITSLYNIEFNATTFGIGGFSGPNVNVAANAGAYTLQSTGLGATGLTLAGGITNNSTNRQTINFTGSGAVGITLSAAQTFNAGSGGLSFGANTGVNLNGNALTIQGTGTGANAVTLGGVVSGAGAGSALNKQQSGTLVVNAAATYAGPTTIGVAPNTSGGTIQLGVANGLPTTTALTFYDNGVSRSTLDLHGFNQTVTSLNDGGNNSGLITNAGTGTPTFTLSNSLANFYYGQLTGSLAFVMNGASSEELGGANTFSGGATFKSGTIVVAVSNVGTASGALGPSTGSVILGDTGGSQNAAILLGRAGGAGPGAAGGLTLANDIIAQDGNSGTLTLGGQNTSGVSTFSGNVTLGTTPASPKGITLSAAAGGEVDFNGNFSGTGGLLKQGAGTLALNGNSSFGPTAAGSTNIFIDQGTVSLGNSNAAGSTAHTGRIAMGSSVATNQDSVLTISTAGANVANPIDVRHFPGINGAKSIGGTNASGTAAFSGDITLHDNVTFTAAGGTVTFAGAISTGAAGSPYANEDVFAGIPTGGFNAGPGVMTAGTGTIELTGANTFNGEIVVNGGITLQARGGGTFGSGANNAVRMYGTSTVNIADATTISTRINPHGTPGSDLETIGATNAAATAATYSGSIFLDDNATLSSANVGATLSFTGTTFDIKNRVLTVTGSGNTSIPATITNSTAGGSLVKSGAGTLTLSAAAGNSYSGGTAIGGGTLRVSNTSGSATGAGAVAVNSGGTLAGSGIITGAVNVNSGGTLSPGTSPGPITLGATTYNDGGTYRWEIADWTGAQGVGYDFQNTTGTLTIAATPGTFPANTLKIDIVGLSGGSPGSIAHFDAAHSRSWTIAEASTGISGFAANKFTIDTSHIVDNLAGGGFSLSTANGAGSIQDLVLTFTPGQQQAAVIGQITSVPASGSIITGGSLPFSITVQNAGPAGAADLHFSASAGANVSGSVPGPVTVSAGGTSAPQPGLSFTGTAVGPSQPGSFTVSDAAASNSPQPGSVTVNVFDHASTGGFNGGTISLPSVVVGYSGPVAGTSSFTVTNGSAPDYRVNLKATGGTANSVTVSGFSGVAPGAGGAISASLAAGRAAGPINQVIAVTLADDSSLSGASANLSTKNVTVTGNIYAHATPSDDSGAPGSFADGMLDMGNIHAGYSAAVTSLGSLTVFNGTVGDNRVPLAGSGAQSGGSTAGLSLNTIGGGGALVPGGSAAIVATLATGLPAGAINQDFTYTFADDSALNGASANVGTATITAVGNVYSGQSIWRGRQQFGGMQPQGATSNLWGTFSNWSGGSPGLDPNFAASDSATFGAQAGNVTVDLAGVTPRLISMTFNHTGSYTITNSSGTGSITLTGSTPSVIAAGSHSITVPLSLSATTSITVTDPADSLTISGPISGTGAGLSKLGAGSLTLAHANSFSGGTTVSAGTLRTTANIALGGGPLAVNATTGVNTVVNLGGNETVSRLAGAASGNGSAAVSVAAGKTLIVTQATTSSFAGTVALAGAGSTLIKTGSGTLEIARGANLASGSILIVSAGTLRFNVATGSATVSSGATASIASNAILELAGGVSALSDDGAATHRADIANSGKLSVGNTSVAASTSQQVGGIDGAGRVLINDGATLTANHIIQSSLVIGGGATAVIAASDSNGQPLGESPSGPQTAEGFGAALAGSSTLDNIAPLPTETPALSRVTLENTAPLPVFKPICVVSEMYPVTAVPEPATWLLAISAATLLAAAGRRRSRNKRTMKSATDKRR